MKKFNSESYSLGFLDGLFALTKSLNESDVDRYLELCSILDQKIDQEILKYIKLVYPFKLLKTNESGS